MIYLASPYTHPDPAVMQQRYELACAAAAQLFNNGKHVFSPIGHWHPIAVNHDLPLDWATWIEYDKDMIRRCDRLTVLMIPGWQESRGVTAEIEYARHLGKPVHHWAFQQEGGFNVAERS